MDLVTYIGNNTSKSGASIQSRTAFECWRNREFGDGSIGSITARRTQRCERLYGYRNKFDTKMSDQEGKDVRECYNNTQNKANRCFCTTMLFKSQGWYSTGHGSHTPLQDDGVEPMLDLARNLQYSICIHFSRCADLVRTYTELV